MGKLTKTKSLIPTTVGVIIPAGGSGSRMGLKTEKQFLKLDGKTILERTLAKFNSHKEIDEIILVLPVNKVKSKGMELSRLFKKISVVISGGETRTESVTNGFNAFEKEHSTVLIHDSVRPFIDKETISETIKSCRKCDSVTVAVPAKETIKVVTKTKIVDSPDRSKLWYTQTPQGFKYNCLKEALEYAKAKKIGGTDECQLAERMGKDVRVVMGNYFNIKITTKEDLVFAKAICSKS